MIGYEDDIKKLSEEKIAKTALLKSMDIEIVLVKPEEYFKDRKIFTDSASGTDDFAPLPLRSDLYNTEWYYLKCMGM